VLASPQDSTIISAPNVRCKWEHSQPAVTKYWIEVALDSLFDQLHTIDTNVVDTSKIIANLQNTKTYWWRVRAFNNSGWGAFSEIRTFKVVITEVIELPGTPREFSLSQNYPNPFNPITNFRFSTKEDGYVVLNIFDALGKEIARIVDQELHAGFYSITWDASNTPSGMYFYRMQAGEFVATKKLVLMK
jgi:hypothetical protein